MIVDPMVARSIVVFEPMETSSSITTFPNWGMDLNVPSACGACPKPSEPITELACITTLLPMIQSLYITTPGYMVQSQPMITFLPILTRS